MLKKEKMYVLIVKMLWTNIGFYVRVKENSPHFLYFPSSSSIPIIIIENEDPSSMAGAQNIHGDYPSLTYLTKHASANMSHRCQESASFFTGKKKCLQPINLIAWLHTSSAISLGIVWLEKSAWPEKCITWFQKLNLPYPEFIFWQKWNAAAAYVTFHARVLTPSCH